MRAAVSLCRAVRRRAAPAPPSAAARPASSLAPDVAAALASLTPTPARTAAELAVLNNGHPRNNVPASVKALVHRRLLAAPGHPLATITRRIAAYWAAPRTGGAPLRLFDSLSPVVSAKANFDDLQFPADHVSRNTTETFWLTDDHLLRPHTSAHQTQLLRSGARAFLVAGDVYRRDEVDATHYPVFHQMEGVRLLDETLRPAAPLGTVHSATEAAVVADLKAGLEGLVEAVFGAGVERRWIDAYFPFTSPSFELEVRFQDRWLEVLGCGAIAPRVLAAAGLPPHEAGWAFGLGLERLAMVLFGVPDIRLFWSTDRRFLDQFTDDRIVAFEPFSKFPPCYKDVAFWLPASGWHPHDLFELVRDVAGDLVERVALQDQFTHGATGRRSECYRITYRSMERNLTNAEVDALQAEVRTRLAQRLHVDLR
jgi:phenylalanyl-tRNA synthetase alpha chain